MRKKDRKLDFTPRHLSDKLSGVYNFSDYRKTGNRILYGTFISLLIFFVLVALVPIVWLIITSFKSIEEINSTSYHLFPQVFDITKIFKVWEKMNLLRYYGNTLRLAPRQLKQIK